MTSWQMIIIRIYREFSGLLSFFNVFILLNMSVFTFDRECIICGELVCLAGLKVIFVLFQISSIVQLNMNKAD